MKKAFLVLTIGLAIFGSGCKKKKDSNATPEGVAENKKTMEKQGVDFVNEMNAMKSTKAGLAIVNLTSLFNSTTKAGSVLQNDLPLGKLLSVVNSTSSNGAVTALKAETTSTLNFKEEIGKVAATYTYNSKTKTFDSSAAESANVIKVIFPGTSGSTTNNAEFKVYGMAFSSVATKNALYSTNNAITACSAYLKVDGTDAMTYTLSVAYDANGYPSSLSTKLTVDTYVLAYDLTYSTSKLKSDMSFKHKDVTLLGQGIELNGTLTEAKAQELNTYYNGNSASQNATKIGEFVNAATIYFQVMDIKVVGSIDLQNFTKEYDKLSTIDKDNFTQSDADIVNKYCSLYGIFASSDKKIADVTIYLKAPSKDAALMLNFPDGSKVDFQTYVEDPNNFADFKAQINQLTLN